MEAARTQAHEHVAFYDAVGTDHLRAIDNAHGEARQVVIVGIHNAGMLGHLAADKRAARLTAAFRDAAHNLGDMLLLQLANGDVVQEEQGSAPHARMSFTHIATRSMPTVSCLPMSWATLSFVPTPSVPETISGSSIP